MGLLRLNASLPGPEALQTKHTQCRNPMPDRSLHSEQGPRCSRCALTAKMLGPGSNGLPPGTTTTTPAIGAAGTAYLTGSSLLRDDCYSDHFGNCSDRFTKSRKGENWAGTRNRGPPNLADAATNRVNPCRWPRPGSFSPQPYPNHAQFLLSRRVWAGTQRMTALHGKPPKDKRADNGRKTLGTSPSHLQFENKRRSGLQWPSRREIRAESVFQVYFITNRPRRPWAPKNWRAARPGSQRRRLPDGAVGPYHGRHLLPNRPAAPRQPSVGQSRTDDVSLPGGGIHALHSYASYAGPPTREPPAVSLWPSRRQVHSSRPNLHRRQRQRKLLHQ